MDTEVHQVKPISYIGVLVRIAATQLPVQFPADTFLERGDNFPSAWTAAIPEEDLDGIFGFWFCPIPALDVAGTV